MSVLTPEKALRKVQVAAEKIRNDKTASVGTVSLGDVVRQGDVYLVSIGDLPKARVPTTNRQLAPGDSQGSRHVLHGECELYAADKSEVLQMIAKHVSGYAGFDELVGPVFKTLGDVEVSHPEHGNRILPAGEVFAVVYQRAFADEVRRQID